MTLNDVTKFATLIENMSRTGLYDRHVFRFSFDDFMRNSNFGIGVLHVNKSNIDVFFVTSFLFSLKFLLFHRIEYPKRCEMTVPSKSNVPSLWPGPLTYEGQLFLVNWVQAYRYILYTFQIDISSSSREIKYQNNGRTHRHTHTDTQTDRVKTIPRNPLRGEVIMSYFDSVHSWINSGGGGGGV